jgi:hypothetical protein
MSNKVYVAVRPKCGFCGKPAEYDGATTQGPWAFMCEDHFLLDGVGLGTGRGQMLVVAEPKDQPDTYEAWMRQVDRVISSKIGLTSEDLSDFNSRDLYDAGVSPEEAADECLSEQDFDMGWME